MSKKVAFHNLGCKVNSYELEFVQQRFTENAFRIVPFDQKADIYVVNTCTVTNIADRKSRQMLHRAKTLNPDAIVVAMGCYVETSKAEAGKDLGIDVLIGNCDKGHAYEKIVEFLNNKDSNNTEDKHLLVNDINETKEYDEFKLSFTTEHTRVHVKIQDGCNQFCTYCIIPYARGRVRSREIADILEEVRKLAEGGYKEVVLTGIHLSSYGVDFKEEEKKQNLLSLIRAVHEIHGIQRIRLGSLEPRIITEEFLEGISSLPKVCPHFHLSLQSGCNKTLKDMNRRYSAEEYADKCELIRKYYPAPALTTDVIVGFPQETEEDFQESYEFVKNIHFYETHIFKYSRRQGTKAAAMKGQLTEAEKAKRSEKMLELHDLRAGEYEENMIGRNLEILIEEEAEIDGRSFYLSHSREYVKVAVEKKEGLHINDLLTVKITGFAKEHILRGELGLLNSRTGAVIMISGMAIAYCTIMIIGFVRRIPIELEEAAMIEGAGRFRICFTIIFPLLKPILATVATLQFLAVWNELMYLSFCFRVRRSRQFLCSSMCSSVLTAQTTILLLQQRSLL